MIKTINGWRAVFALMIVLFHVGVAGLEEMTWAGVSFFLMASGFLLTLKHPFAQLDGAGYRRFAWGHALKLYPLHWLTLLLWLVATAMVGTLVIDPVALPLNAGLLQSWSLTHAIYFSYNKFSWFLCTLLFCYLCYPLLARRYATLPSQPKLVILAVLILIDIIILAVVGKDDYSRTALYVFPPVRLIDFIIGMTLASSLDSIKRWPALGKGENGTDAELVILALLSVVVMSYRTYSWLLPWSDAVIWWLPIAFLIVMSYLYDRREGFIGKILASRPLQWLGNISFEIFMLQGVAALVFNFLVAPGLAHLGFGRPSPFDSAGATDLFSISPYALIPWFILPIDILLAWIVNRLFTRPVGRLIKRISHI